MGDLATVLGMVPKPPDIFDQLVVMANHYIIEGDHTLIVVRSFTATAKVGCGRSLAAGWKCRPRPKSGCRKHRLRSRRLLRFIRKSAELPGPLARPWLGIQVRMYNCYRNNRVFVWTSSCVHAARKDPLTNRHKAAQTCLSTSKTKNNVPSATSPRNLGLCKTLSRLFPLRKSSSAKSKVTGRSVTARWLPLPLPISLFPRPSKHLSCYGSCGRLLKPGR